MQSVWYSLYRSTVYRTVAQTQKVLCWRRPCDGLKIQTSNSNQTVCCQEEDAALTEVIWSFQWSAWWSLSACETRPVSRGAQLSSEKFRLSIILSVNNFDWPIRTPSDCIRLILFLAIFHNFHNFHNFIAKNNLDAQLASPISYEPIDKCHDWNKRQTLIDRDDE